MGLINAGTTLIVLGICLLAFFPVFSDLVGDANTAIDNAPNMAYGGVAKLLLAFFGVAFVVGGLFDIYKKMHQPEDITRFGLFNEDD